MKYERFIRTAEWVILMAPMSVMVDAAPARLAERDLDPEMLWKRHIEERQLASSTSTGTRPPAPTGTSPVEEEESADGEDDSLSESISDGISSESSKEEEEENPNTTSRTMTRTTTRNTLSTSYVSTSTTERLPGATGGVVPPPPPPTPPVTRASDVSIPPTATDLGALATPTQVLGETEEHIRMEIGVSAGVVAVFIIIGFLIGWYLKKNGKAPILKSLFKNPFKSSRSGSGNGPVVGEYPYQPSDIQPSMKQTTPAIPPVAALMSEKRISDAPSMSDVDRVNSLRRKYTITRTMPEKPSAFSEPAPPLPIGRRASNASTMSSRSNLSSRESIRSMGSNGLPRGPKLRVIPSDPVDPFSDDLRRTDPFADPIPAVPAPLRFPRRSQTSITRLDVLTEPLQLTDPRVSDNRTLVVANRSDRDSIISPPPVPKKPLNMHLPLRIGDNVIPQGESRFSWTTKAETGTPGFQQNSRMSGVSATSTEAPPKHRNVKSWAKSQTNRLERHPVQDTVSSPRYAKSEKELYDRRSMNSGMDTRRTEYEYDSD